MYGRIGRIFAVPGERDALAAFFVESVSAMPGCLSYVVALDEYDSDVIWVTEVWESEAAHTASLSLPTVRDAIARGREMIAAMPASTVTLPVGGYGLDQSTT